MLSEDEDERSARVIVPDHQLSLAIGKEGQNARLAAKLTGWRIDIKSESQYREMLEATWMADFNEAVAQDEAGRDQYEDELYDDEMIEEDQQVVEYDDVLSLHEIVGDNKEAASTYLDILENTIDAIDEMDNDNPSSEDDTLSKSGE
jgi:N utilization substance protein A